MSLEALIEDNQWVARQHLPVVDRNQHLVGSISFSDVKGYQPPEEIIFQEKKQRLADIFRKEASAWGYQAAHATVLKLDALFTWPVNVAL